MNPTLKVVVARTIAAVGMVSLLHAPLSLAGTQALEVSRTSGIQVAVGECLARSVDPQQSTKSSSVADAITGSIITTGINYIGKALVAAGASKTWTLVGARNFQGGMDQFPKCVLVVRGTFFTKGAYSGATWKIPNGWPSDLVSKLGERGIWPSTTPDFMFEGQIVDSDDKSAKTIRPVIASYVAPIGTRTFRWGKSRSIALFFAITTPGVKPTVEDNPAASIVLGQFSPGTSHQYEERGKKAVSQAGSIVDGSSPYEARWFSISESDITKPLTMTVMLSETQDESTFVSFLGDVFSDQKVKDAATETASNVLISSVREKAQQDALTKAQTLANDADRSYVAAVKDLKACKSVGDGDEAKGAAADARSSLRLLLAADRLSPRPQNLVSETSIESIDLKASGESIRASCSTVLDDIDHS